MLLDYDYIATKEMAMLKYNLLTENKLTLDNINISNNAMQLVFYPKGNKVDHLYLFILFYIGVLGVDFLVGLIF